jgi:hypothetical protein
MPEGKKKKEVRTGLLANYKTQVFAPAELQSFASLLMISRSIVGGAALLLKTLAFRSFQIVQLTSIVRKAMPLRMGEALQDIKVHHSSIERFVVHS